MSKGFLPLNGVTNSNRDSEMVGGTQQWNRLPGRIKCFECRKTMTGMVHRLSCHYTLPFAVDIAASGM